MLFIKYCNLTFMTKEYVENADLYEPALNNIMATNDA